MQSNTVVVGQPVVCFGHSGKYQGIYIVTAVTPKGTKITVKRESDGYLRTFDQNSRETNTLSSKYRCDYFRTDVEAAQLQQQRTEATYAAATALHNIDTLRIVPRYATQESITATINEMKEKLAEVEAMIALIP